MQNIEEYYKKYGPMVYHRCLEVLKNEDEATDAMQDVFAKLMTIAEKIRHPSTYLYRTATHVCLNLIRKQKNHLSMDVDSVVYNIASSEDLEKNLLLKDKLHSLFQGEKKTTRVIAFMRYIDKMSLRDIADEMDMSISGIKKRLRNIKDKYQKMELEYEEN
ncbi:MAG: sigma-70 family RNA polymerase sigma factor [Leptospirales bacterium]